MPSFENVAPMVQQRYRRIVDDLIELVQSHGNKLSSKGAEKGIGFASSFRVNFQRREIEAIVSDHGSRHKVTIVWNTEPQPDESLTDAYCDCSASRSHDLCKHTWLAVRSFVTELQNPYSELCRSFLKGLDPSAWKQALTPLDSFLRTTRATATPTGPVDEIQENDQWRMTYRLEVEDRRSLMSVSPFEQTRLKNGGWSKGRKWTWGRFLSEDDKLISPLDHKIHELARREMTRRGDFGFYASDFVDTTFIPSTWLLLEVLRGCEYLFGGDDVSEPLRVVDGKPELFLEQDRNGMFVLLPGMAGRKLTGFSTYAIDMKRGFICCDWHKHEVMLCPAESAVQLLFKNLLSQKTTVPRDGVTELLARLTAMEQSLKVNYPAELEGESTQAEARPVLRLAPRQSDGGLIIEIWSRPKTPGPYFEPGVGADAVVSYDSSVRHAAIRDLDAEKANADACCAALNLTRFRSNRPWQWILNGGDESLDFLSELQSRSGDQWTVEWSNSAVQRPEVIAGEIQPADLHLEIKHDHDWFGVEGMIDVGGEKVPLIKILDALRKNSKYIRLDGGKWAKLAEEFRKRLESLADLLHRNQSKLHFDTSAAPLMEEILNDQRIDVKAVVEWRNAIQRLHEARNYNPQVPGELKATLRDYQVEGFKWLSRLAAWGVGGCLADDMGLGKTIQALAVLLERRSQGPTLVIAPVSVGFNWINEATRFAPTLRPHLYRDTERGDFLEAVGPGDLVVASYGLVLRDVAHFKNVKWGTLVLDEAQFIKNSRTKTAQVVRDLSADWRLALTGTPVENQLSDLWSLFRATCPGLFGSWERFREKFADPIEKQNLPEKKLSLARTVRPFILRRTKAEVLKELPARTEVILTAELSKAERKLYEDARLLAVAQLAGLDTGKNESRFQVLAMLTRLRQLACHPKLVDNEWTESSAKLELLLETVEEIREGKHRALIFSQFTSHLDLIRKALDERKITYLYLDGQTPANVRRERVESFQNGHGELFLISLKAGGTGLNLTGADYVIHMDPWWNPAVEDQATDRAHRIGQTKPVMVYRLVAKDTIEEKILSMHESKRNLVSSVMDGSDQAGKMTTDELIDLIKTGNTPEMPDSQTTERPRQRGRPKKPKES